MIDWELVCVMSFFVLAGLICATVAMLGLSRTEKLLAATYLAAFAAQLVTLNLFFNPDKWPELRATEDINNWLASMNRAKYVSDLLWWLSVAAGAAFLISAVRHIWKQRVKIMAKLRLDL
jgi:hypothetical protein